MYFNNNISYVKLTENKKNYLFFNNLLSHYNNQQAAKTQ